MRSDPDCIRIGLIPFNLHSQVELDRFPGDIVEGIIDHDGRVCENIAPTHQLGLSLLVKSIQDELYVTKRVGATGKHCPEAVPFLDGERRVFA